MIALAEPPRATAVVKIGGGLLAHPEQLAAVLDGVERAAGRGRVVIVPGGGPFADAVRDADRRYTLPDSTAHWMAVLAMDQHAYLLASRLRRARIVTDATGVGAAFDRGDLPVLAPFRWLHDADPLPHSWAVTSDSIAAWVAGVLGAPRLVLAKPTGVSGAGAVDAHLARALPGTVICRIVTADRIDELPDAIGEPDS